MNQEEKIEAAITELIDSVERFFSIGPLRFLDIDDGNDDISSFTFLNEYETRFHRFHNSFEYLLETLEPWAYDVQERVEEAEKVLDPIFRGDEKLFPELSPPWGVMCDGIGELAFAAQKIGFYVGVFVGAKRQGATRDNLVEIGKALTLPCIQQWEAAQSNAEDRAKRETAAKKKRKKLDLNAFQLVEGGKLKGDFNA